jgi:hypothetical protein
MHKQLLASHLPARPLRLYGAGLGLHPQAAADRIAATV